MSDERDALIQRVRAGLTAREWEVLDMDPEDSEPATPEMIAAATGRALGKLRARRKLPPLEIDPDLAAELHTLTRVAIRHLTDVSGRLRFRAENLRRMPVAGGKERADGLEATIMDLAGFCDELGGWRA